MKTPDLTAHLPTCASFTAEALAKTLQGFDRLVSRALLAALKEASVRDQNFEQAQTFRAAVSALQKSKIGIQPRAKRCGRESSNPAPKRTRASALHSMPHAPSPMPKRTRASASHA